MFWRIEHEAPGGDQIEWDHGWGCERCYPTGHYTRPAEPSTPEPVSVPLNYKGGVSDPGLLPDHGDVGDAYYVVSEDNKVAVWDGEKWVWLASSEPEWVDGTSWIEGVSRQWELMRRMGPSWPEWV
jgi:hypothetical protein